MIRDTYKIIKAKITVGYSYYSTGYETEIWFEGMNLEERGCHEQIPQHPFKEMGIIQKGFSFKKANAFLETEEGKTWLSDFLQVRDYDNEKKKIQDNVRVAMYRMGLEKLKEIESFIKSLEN